MAKFYFHIRVGDHVYEDARGGEFGDLPAAWKWAVGDVRTMIREGAVPPPLDRAWIEICDYSGESVAALPFLHVGKPN